MNELDNNYVTEVNDVDTSTECTETKGNGGLVKVLIGVTATAVIGGLVALGKKLKNRKSEVVYDDDVVTLEDLEEEYEVVEDSEA